MRARIFSILLCSLLLHPTYSCALPSSVLVIRHGEKNKSEPDGFLSSIGWTRAAALIAYFGGNVDISNTPELNISSTPSPFPPPYAIHAARANPDPLRSKRIVDTVLPLANALRIPLHTCFLINQTAELANLILTTKRYDGQEILICYAHDEIPELVNQLITQAGGTELDLANYPKKRFDLVYVIDYTGNTPSFSSPFTPPISAGGGISLTVTIQELIYGDPSKVPASPFPLN